MHARGSIDWVLWFGLGLISTWAVRAVASVCMASSVLVLTNPAITGDVADVVGAPLSLDELLLDADHVDDYVLLSSREDVPPTQTKWAASGIVPPDAEWVRE